MEFIALSKCLALIAASCGILVHSGPPCKVRVVPLSGPLPAVGKLGVDRYTAINRLYNRSGTETKDGEVAVEVPETKPKSEVLSEKSVNQMGDPSTSNASLPAKGASASQVAGNTTKRSGEEGKAERYPNILRITDDDRERASRFKELPFARRKHISFYLPQEDDKKPTPDHAAYAPALEVPLKYASGTTIRNEADKPKVVATLWKNGAVKPSTEVEEPIYDETEVTPMPPVEVDEHIYEEAEVSSIPPDETYEPIYDEAELSSIPPDETYEPIYDEAELSSIPPDETYEPIYDDLYSEYSDESGPSTPIPSLDVSATAGQGNGNAPAGSLNLENDAKLGVVPEKETVYSSLLFNLRKVPEGPVEPNSPVYSPVYEPSYDNLHLYGNTTGYNSTNKDSKPPTEEPLYDVVPLELVAVDTSPSAGTSYGSDSPTIRKPLPKKPRKNAAVSGAKLDDITRSPAPTKTPAREPETFTDHFNDGIEQASGGIKAGFKTLGSYASKQANATKRGFLKVGSVVGSALGAAGNCGKYFALQIRRTTGDALAKLYARIVPEPQY